MMANSKSIESPGMEVNEILTGGRRGRRRGFTLPESVVHVREYQRIPLFGGVAFRIQNIAVNAVHIMEEHTVMPGFVNIVQIPRFSRGVLCQQKTFVQLFVVVAFVGKSLQMPLAEIFAAPDFAVLLHGVYFLPGLRGKRR